MISQICVERTIAGESFGGSGLQQKIIWVSRKIAEKILEKRQNCKNQPTKF